MKHADDCQSHIVDVRGRPDECTCGADVQSASPRPIDMVLHCPSCDLQHIDEVDDGWDNPPHRSHLCHGCGCIWRPADVPTNGVAAIKTRGKADTYPAESGASSPAEGRAGKEARDALIPPGFVVAPREVVERLSRLADEAENLKQSMSEAWVGSYGPGGKHVLAQDIRAVLAALPPPGGGKGSSVAESTDARCSTSSAAAEDAPRQSERGEP